MQRKCEPGFHFLAECGVFSDLNDLIDFPVPGRDVHTSYHCYLFMGEEKNLLFDTLPSRKRPQIFGVLDELLDGEGLDYVVPSHADLPHAANTGALLEHYPDCKAVITSESGSMHDLYDLGDAVKVESGDRLDLGGDWEVTFYEPPHFMADQDITLWMKEAHTGALCTVDWFAYFHDESECFRFADEYDRPITTQDFLEVYGRSFFWLQWVDLDKTLAALDAVKEDMEPEYLCPTHGSPIREDCDEYIDMTKDMVRDIYENGMLQYRV